MGARSNPLSCVEVLVALTKRVFLWNGFVALGHLLHSTQVVLLNAILQHVLLVLTTHVVVRCVQLTVGQFVAFCDCDALVNFLILLGGDGSLLALA